MKKLLLVLLIVVMAVALIFGSCAEPAPAPAPAPTPAPAPAPTPAPTPAPAKPIELKFTSWTPPAPIAIGECNLKWKAMVEERSEGRLKIELFEGGSLATRDETLRALQTGIADIGYHNVTELPLGLITRLPLLGISSKWAAAKIHMELLNDFPQMTEELGNLKVLATLGMPPEQLFFTKKEVRVPDDIKGMKMIAGGEIARVLDAAGAAAMDLPAGDWYTSLERGLVEGHNINFLASIAFGTIELFQYHTLLGDSGTGLVVMGYEMNADSWNSLPPDLQKILAEATTWVSEEVMQLDERDQQASIDIAKEKNHTFIYLTPEEVQLWADLAKPVHQEWIADNAAKAPTQEMYDEIQRLIVENK
jgi:TRAP-type C4-dicarboxylate transport system substrate-binding protein